MASEARDPTQYEGKILESPAGFANPAPTVCPRAVTITLPPTLSRPPALTDVTNLPPVETNTVAAPAMDIDNTEEGDNRVFCPADLRESIIMSMERHLNAHPLIPGYCHPSPASIREWAVRQMYNYCYNNDLPEVWVYLWENWYKRGRWELWACAEHPEIPRLETTMMVESQDVLLPLSTLYHCSNQINYSSRRIKRNFLHHFHKPRLDLLVWILVVKLAPRYYRRLDIIMADRGRYRELPSWRKDFKSEWKRCREAPITLPLNEKYRPDPYRWSRFLLCKHLVQAVHPVDPIFFLEVTRNRTTPFWSHPTLRPLESTPPPLGTTPVLSSATSNPARYNQFTTDDDSDKELVEIWAGPTFDERLTAQCEVAGFFRLGDQFQSREHRENSTRSVAPTMWSAGNAMFFRTRPVPAERET
ncbi:hypothetical protein B0H16DRAFT_1470528 [Mycena metata]|uniref:Uncharacterized protein n=1 Tax=Mycena metata TaxID=1033252 RepID=A0AAD7MS50_9AGAR|nr:hypothetical protein B0H16DRAFT_1470528 [Mycena metata]